jgi:hypothetical protein
VLVNPQNYVKLATYFVLFPARAIRTWSGLVGTKAGTCWHAQDAGTLRTLARSRASGRHVLACPTGAHNGILGTLPRWVAHSC